SVSCSYFHNCICSSYHTVWVLELWNTESLLLSPHKGSAAGAVACIACPTLYAYLKKTDPGVPAQLLEYDERFGQYGCDFTFYDYNRPEELPAAMKHAYRVIVADPPYLVLFLPYQRLPIKKCLISS
uniref:Nucleic acid binding n=1 Tax=Zea mays TaxID=4577 RepID=A0A804QL15_MAIZE